MTLILFVFLAKKVNLIPPNFGDLQFGRFLKNGTYGCIFIKSCGSCNNIFF